MKRKRPSPSHNTPTKARAARLAVQEKDTQTLPPPSLDPPTTPSKPKSSLKPTLNGTPRLSVNPNSELSPSPRKTALQTPQKHDSVRFAESTVSPPPVVTNADRSARRKSVRHILARAVDEDVSDEDEEEELAKRIYGDSESSGSEEEEEQPAAKGSPKKTPGKAKKTKENDKDKEIPLPLLGPHELYFHQNRPGRQATSTSTLASLPQLDHNTYFNLLRTRPPDHTEERELLSKLHRGNFSQWRFELSSGFNILLYGYGSKRKLLQSFASELYTTPGSVVIINGYVSSLTIKDILTNIGAALCGANHSLRLGANPNEMLDTILTLLDDPKQQLKLSIITHNIDGEALRPERTQVLLSRLASHRKVSLVASIDHIRAPLLWDAARISQFNFLWHDATTFEPYSVECSADDALALVSGTGRTGGAKGVKYVLASLPSNAKSLFRELVSHQLQTIIDDPEAGKKGKSGEDYGIEYRVLYQKAVSEFICSNDVAFRTLLKEFQDHQMVASKKDGQGTEMLWAPFRKDELEGILEEIL